MIDRNRGSQSYDEFKMRLLALLIEIRDELKSIDARLYTLEQEPDDRG